MRMDLRVGKKVAKWHWKVIISNPTASKNRGKVHINLEELRAIRLLAKRTANSKGKWCRRQIILSDSEVTVASHAKGRSSARRINRKLRLTLPWILGGESYFYLLWTPSAANPADAPSRNLPLWKWEEDFKKLQAFEDKSWQRWLHEPGRSFAHHRGQGCPRLS